MMKKYEPVKLNHNPNWPCIPDHPYRILIRMTQDQAKLCYMNLKHQRPDVDKIYSSKIHLNQSINYLLTEKEK